VLAGLIAAAGIVSLMATMGGSAAGPPDPAFDLAMGLGDYDEAARIANDRWGRASKEYREAAQRRREAALSELERRGRRCLETGNWKGACEAFEQASRESPPARRSAVEVALRFCRDMCRAADLESRGEWREAHALYAAYATPAMPCREYVRESLERAARHLEPGPR
jgi:hypothetical protein